MYERGTQTTFLLVSLLFCLLLFVTIDACSGTQALEELTWQSPQTTKCPRAKEILSEMTNRPKPASLPWAMASSLPWNKASPQLWAVPTPQPGVVPTPPLQAKYNEDQGIRKVLKRNKHQGRQVLISNDKYSASQAPTSEVANLTLEPSPAAMPTSLPQADSLSNIYGPMTQLRAGILRRALQGLIHEFQTQEGARADKGRGLNVILLLQEKSPSNEPSPPERTHP